MEGTAQWKDFELILTVKMETRHPVEGSFSSEFLACTIQYDTIMVSLLPSLQRIRNG